MTNPRYAELARRALQSLDGGIDAPPPEANGEARARGIAAVERALAERRRKKALVRTWSRVALAASVAAAVGTGAWVARRPALVAIPTATPPQSAPEATVARVEVFARDTLAPSSPLPLGKGGHVAAPGGGHAVLAFATGTRLTIEDDGELTLLETGATQSIGLTRGAVHADVAPLAPGHRFLLETDDAEIEVHGTSFRVALVPPAECGGGTVTRVSVEEGTVTVRHAGREDRVPAGNAWPTGCDVPAARVTAASPSTSAAATAPSLAAASATSAKSAPHRHAFVAHAASAIPAEPIAPSATAAAPAPSARLERTEPASSLANQNDLFAEAIAAKRRGDAAAAIAAFDRFLHKYPHAPLAESASAQRMKLLAGVDHARAVAAAEAYLADYPGGFAAADARAIARSTAP